MNKNKNKENSQKFWFHTTIKISAIRKAHYAQYYSNHNTDKPKKTPNSLKILKF